jgi:hypothetical protein
VLGLIGHAKKSVEALADVPGARGRPQVGFVGAIDVADPPRWRVRRLAAVAAIVRFPTPGGRRVHRSITPIVGLSACTPDDAVSAVDVRQDSLVPLSQPVVHVETGTIRACRTLGLADVVE